MIVHAIPARALSYFVEAGGAVEPNEGVLWDAPAHTLAKIEILSRYLGAWLPIFLQTHPNALYVDGFAGPGEYAGGQEGSPVVALRTLLEHKAAQRMLRGARMVYYFVESRADRAAHLQELLAVRYPQQAIPEQVVWRVFCSDFEDIMDSILTSIERRGAGLAPTFLFVDPFGWTGASMRTFARVLRHRYTEIFFTFIVDHISRFLSLPAHKDDFDTVFGDDRWTRVLALTGRQRIEGLIDCFAECLKVIAGARYTQSFEMVTLNGHTSYALIHASTDDTLTAVDRMKDAMWTVDPTGTFSFSDRHFGEATLLGQPDYADLQCRLQDRFAGRGDVGWSIIDRFVLLNTPYARRHFNKYGLRVMERDGRLEVVESPAIPRRRKAGTYAENLRPYLLFRFRR